MIIPDGIEQKRIMETNQVQIWKKVRKFVQGNQPSHLKKEQIEKEYYLNQHKLMNIRLKNNQFIIYVYIKIEKFMSLGVLKIRDKLNELNNQKKYSFILGFCLKKKQIFIKLVSEKSLINEEILSLLQNCNKKIEDQFKSMELQLVNTDIKSFSQLILDQRGHKTINMAGPSILGFDKFKIKRQFIESDEAVEKFSYVINRKKHILTQKWKKSKNILQAIKINQESNTEQLNGGANGIVQIFKAKYQVSPNLSINVQTNQQIQKEIQNKKINSTESEKQQNSYLIRKTFLHDKINYFQLEIKLLKIIRAQRCESINNFYCKPSQLDKLEKIDNKLDKLDSSQWTKVYLYSEYHKRKISKCCNVRKCLNILYTLCEGLVFLQWNGISHRDLKPDNILASKDYVAKIIDFGSACHNKNRKMGQRVRASVLSTNRKYNLRYSDLPKYLQNDINIDEYENHQYFDIYAYGKIIQNLLLSSDNEKELGNQVWECFWYLSSLCQQQNPKIRPPPTHIYAFFAEILKILPLKSRRNQE